MLPQPANPPFTYPSRVAQNDDYILEILLETALITKPQLARAKADRKGDASVIDTLVEQGAMT